MYLLATRRWRTSRNYCIDSNQILLGATQQVGLLTRGEVRIGMKSVSTIVLLLCEYVAERTNGLI